MLPHGCCIVLDSDLLHVHTACLNAFYDTTSAPVPCTWNISRFIIVAFDQDGPHVHDLRSVRFVATFHGRSVSCSSFTTTCYRMTVVLHSTTTSMFTHGMSQCVLRYKRCYCIPILYENFPPRNNRHDVVPVSSRCTLNSNRVRSEVGLFMMEMTLMVITF